MTHKDNLIKLRDAVVKERPPRKEVYWRADPCGLGQARRFLSDAARGDMNAALAFVAEVLPNTVFEISYWPNFSWCVELKSTHEHDGEHWHGKDDYTVNGRAATPARALLIAALNALIEERDV